MPACVVLLAGLVAVTAVSPAVAGEAPERVEVDIGGCDATLERRAVEPAVLVFRTDCAASAASSARALDAALAKRFPDGAIDGAIRSVSLGRIEALPWLSQNLAETAARDHTWDVDSGAPRGGSPEAYVGALLARDGLARPLYPPLAKWGLRVTGTTVEKVLVGDVDGRRLPFDAQLWLRVEPAARPGAPPTAPPH